ncbi:MAG: hypothetical protein Phog2KO_32000 [Phototrophicaceae bacterium]
MYVRRNKRNRFFRKNDRKPSIFRRFLMALLVIIGLAVVGLWQQDMVIGTAYEMFGPEVTPTPLPGELAQQAQDLFWQGNLEGATEIWERVIAQRPDSVDYLYEYGMILIDLDDGRNQSAEQAGEIAMDIISIDSNDPRGYALRARSLVWTGNSSLAITVAQAGIDISPNFAPLYAALSRAYIGEGNLRAGQENGIQAIEYASGDVRSYWAYATSLASSGARDEAIAEYERTITINPTFLPPYFELAGLYLAANRDQEAIDTYNRILGVQGTNARALLRQCQAYRKVGQFQQARGLCEDAVRADPTYVSALFQLGQIQYNESEFSLANEMFQTCMDLSPDSLECIYYLGLTEYYLAQAEYNEVCVPNNLTALECEATQICQVGWNLLEDALLLADTRLNTSGDIEIITIGLTAIQGDPACSAISGRPIPTPIPEVTPEVTAEAEA